MPTREIRFRYAAVDGNARHEIAILQIVCDALVKMNELMIRGDPSFFERDLYGVRYIPPPSCRSSHGVQGCQPVKGIVPLLESRQGTCIDLACAFCALRRVKYQDASAEVLVTSDRGLPGLYHTTVVYAGNQIYDPQTI